MKEITDDHNKFLEKFLEDVVFDGWNKSCLEKASLSLYDNKNYAYILFPNGIEDVINYFSFFIDHKMLSLLDEEHLLNLRTHEKIKFLLNMRLKVLETHKLAIRRMYDLDSIILNIQSNIMITWNVSDLLWNLINDQSTDYNYYTKRSILALLYTKVLKCFAYDNSENHELTAKFLDEELNKILKIGRCKKKMVTRIENIAKLPFIRLIARKFYREQ